MTIVDMIQRRLMLLAIVLFLMPLTAAAQDQVRILQSNAAGDRVHIIDPATNGEDVIYIPARSPSTPSIDNACSTEDIAYERILVRELMDLLPLVAREALAVALSTQKQRKIQKAVTIIRETLPREMFFDV